MLTADARTSLLALAHASVQAAVRGAEPDDPPPAIPDLHQPGAAFVTLRRGGDLRGCIGHLRPDQPLWVSVREMAAAAATRDDRFAPVAPDELPELSIEISVLSPRHRIDGPASVVVGRDGLYVRLGANSGLLLPQVAAEHAWSAGEFLAQTCRKAGLPVDAWRDPAAIVESFSAEVFGDEPGVEFSN